jgi:hypothetical protein
MIRFKPGQVWRYHTRQGEEESTITAIEVEESAAHVFIQGLNVTTPGGLALTEVFLPISLEALSCSVEGNVVQTDGQEFHTLRARWVAEHDTRGHGYFTLPPAEFFDALEQGKLEDEQ